MHTHFRKAICSNNKHLKQGEPTFWIINIHLKDKISPLVKKSYAHATHPKTSSIAPSNKNITGNSYHNNSHDPYSKTLSDNDI